MQSQREPTTFSLPADLRKKPHSPAGHPRRDFFGLRRNPFDLTPDPRFLHRTKQAHDTLRVLNRGITQRRGLILLCGAPGTGKTTLLNTALDRMKADSAVRDHRLRTAVIVNPTLSRDELLEAILDEFRVPCASRNKQQRLESLLEMMLDVRRRDGIAILIVDEAQLLTIELLGELLSLLNLQTFTEKLLQIVLSSHQSLEGRLERFAMCHQQPQVAMRCKTTPLSLEETEDYIQHRLSVAGARNRSIFLREAVEAVYAQSGGIPRTVNLLCADALASADLMGVQKVSLQMIEEAAAKTNLCVARSSEIRLHSSGSADFPIAESPAPPPNDEKARSHALLPPKVIPRSPQAFQPPATPIGSKDGVLHHRSSWARCRTRQFDRWCSRNFTRKRCRIWFGELTLAAALLLGMTQAQTYGEPWPRLVRAMCGFAGLILTAVVAGLGVFLLADGEPPEWLGLIASIKRLLKTLMASRLAQRIRFASEWLQEPLLKGLVLPHSWFLQISRVPGRFWPAKAPVPTGRRFGQHPRPTRAGSSIPPSPVRRFLTVPTRRPQPKSRKPSGHLASPR